jgi:hypothetical protein
MCSFKISSHGGRSPCLARRLSAALVCGALSLAHMGAQAAPAKASASTSATAQGSDSSIESEMLTYRALESNSEAVACDIAAYLKGVPATFTTSSGGSTCSVQAEANSNASVVLFPFDQTLVDGFQLWRADMEIMNELQQRAAAYCPATSQIEVHQKGVVGDVLGIAPAGAALNIAQGVFGMVATGVDISPVIGNIQDQTFMNGVARELRVLNVPVLMPGAYHPYSLNGIDESKSPFLASLHRFFATRDCVTGAAAKDTNDTTLAGILNEMNTFLATLNGGTTPASKSNPAQETAAENANPQTAGGAQNQTSPSPSPLMAILSADGLAQKLGVNPVTGQLPDHGDWQHILFLKALESGGSVTKESNIFGSKVRYSGGAVGTYALFTIDGELECSGNVFDFGGSVAAKIFEKELRDYTPDPASQLIFQRGGCRVPAKP